MKYCRVTQIKLKLKTDTCPKNLILILTKMLDLKSTSCTINQKIKLTKQCNKKKFLIKKIKAYNTNI